MTREDSLAVEAKAVRVGNYKFTGKVLGKGSFAVVQEAVHVDLKVKVSVKTINMAKCNSYVLKHLKREASILQQLDHPYIMRLFETIKYGNIYCMVTELVSGGDLLTYLHQQKDKQLVEPVTRRLIRQVTAALCYLHGKGIVHRDLKLENIMLDSLKKNIKLIDFGLSNRWRAECPLKTLCGSPEYSAPELFNHGTQYGPEVDMWALGVILYAMAVGRLPFPCASTLMKDPGKKSLFIKLIHNGLSQQHMNRIVGYSPEFIGLLKGLVNPKRDERLSVADIGKDPWLSNNHHWVILQQHDSLDAYDLANVHRQVCGRLDMTEDRLRTELHSRPRGEVAGYLNIMVHEYTRPSMQESSRSFITKTSTRYFTDSLVTKYQPQYMQKEAASKIWVVGAAQKINEVIKAKTPLARSIYTSTTSSTSSSNRSCKSEQNEHEASFGAGDWISKPQIGPFKAKNVNNSSPFNSPKDKAVKLDESHIKFKKKSSELHQPILPSKFKLRNPICKLNMGQERLSKG